jgi:DNA-binding response OmpR family regulator
VTAYALPGDRERFLKMGFDAYLNKPFAPEDLNALMDELTEKVQHNGRWPRKARPPARSSTSHNLATPGDQP